MIEFKISAPGKVILHGEHAVVYGKTAIAASLDLRTTLKFAELPNSRNIKIEFPDVSLSLDLPLSLFQQYFYGDDFNYSSVKSNDLLHDRVQHFIAMINDPSGDIRDNTCRKLSLQAILYLLVCIAYEEGIDIKSFRIYLSTQLTINAGLGSSASFAVCLAACFLHWSRMQKGAHNVFDKDDLEKISKYALNCERIMHGSPSGIDNSVCTYGSVVEFRRGESLNVLPDMPSIKILLVDTRVKRNTKDQVRRMTELKESYPAIVDSILDNIDVISKKAIQVLGGIRDAQISNDTALLNSHYENLSSRLFPVHDHPLEICNDASRQILIRINQGLLSSLNVSHATLDKICSIAWEYTFAAKLTGAGGGGHAYILPLPYTENQLITNLSELLTAKGFIVTMTNLGCSGVKIE